jgi:hypothetical protein
MRILFSVLALCLFATPAEAIVGGGPAPAEVISRSIVTIIGSRGTFCSGGLIAPDIVLTAAHCVLPGADYKVIVPGDNPPRLLEVRRTLSHPQFNVQAILAHRASADVALVQLVAPLPRSKTPAVLGPPTISIEIGARFTIAGVGVTKRGDGSRACGHRQARYLADTTGRSSHEQSSRGARRLYRRLRRTGI